MEKILILLEGGTALASSSGSLDPELPLLTNCNYFKKRYKSEQVVTMDKLLLSEEATFKRYCQIQRKIEDYPNKKVIIITGTDNLAFLSSFIDLHNQNKLIEIVYSQRSLSRPTNKVFKVVDYLVSIMKVKNFRSTLVVGHSQKKINLFSSMVFKIESYKTDCFIDLSNFKKSNTLSKRQFSDTGSLKIVKDPEKQWFVYLNTPLSKKPVEEGAVLLPGLANTDFTTCKYSYTYCIKGPALATYSKNRTISKNFWIRNMVKDYCLAETSIRLL